MTEKKHSKHDGGKRTVRVNRAGEESAAPRPTAEETTPAAVVEPEAAGAAPEAVAPDEEGGAADEVAAAIAERDEYLDHLRRLQAEFDNYRKRVRRDHEELRLRAAETVVESLLPVMDNMARALDAGARHEEGQLIAGLELVAGQLRGTLQGHGLEEIPVEEGALFDPTVHEAIMTQPSDDHAEGTVLQVLERGYLLHGRLLRPVKVIVSS